MNEDATTPTDDWQDLRVAVVMNGGVSLAIWMGGVTVELDRLRRGQGAYGELLAATQSTARIDVIAGASAGGINGALLALAMARGSELSPETIRNMWLDDGDVETLLRRPWEDSPSLFYGDAYFLPCLERAFEDVARAGGRLPTDTPVHLSITGTTLTGELKLYPDRFGAQVPDLDHRALFKFLHRMSGDDGAAREDFESVGRLSLAARSSASFPAAFEPSWCPVGPDHADEAHPDMRVIASFGRDRWVIDGGVLVNTPFRPALDVIRALPAERAVRRVLAYVVPHTAVPDQSADKRSETPTSAAVVLASVSRLPRVQSIGRELEEIEETNRGTRRRRTARASMLREVQAESLVDLAHALYPSYRRLRRASAAEDIVALWRDTGVWRGNDPALRNAIAAIEDPPWLPASELSAEAALPGPGETWQWGLAPVEHTANIVLDLLGRAASLPMAGERVGELKRDFHGQLASLRSIQERSQEYWIGVGRALPDNQVPRDELEAPVRDWARFSDELGEVAHELAAITLKISEAAHELGTAEDLRTLVAPLAPRRNGGTDDCLRRLTAFDVVQRSSGADLTGIEQAVELVLMSGDVENAFTPGAAAMGKLAGLQLGHFGSFYKRSWRANDWMWGRLDGADRVVRTLVDPRRLKSLLTSGARTVDDATARLWEAATSSSNPAVREWLDGNCTADDRKAVAAEIRDLAQSDGEPLPTALGKCHSLVRQRVQLEILMDEIPSVAGAVADDERQGTAPDSAGVRWLQRIELDKPPTAEQVRRAFKACNIGTETIGGEFGSDYFTRVSTHAAAVAGAVAQQPLRRVKLLRPALAFVRGVLLTLYLLAQGVLEGSRTGAFVVALALGLGGALVALFLIGTSVPGVLLILGLTLVAAAVLLSLLRKLYLQVIGAVLVSAAVVAGFRVYSNHHPAKWLDHLAAAGAVVLLALCLMLLGRSRRARSRPAD